jgi:hypothetical protein
MAKGWSVGSVYFRDASETGGEHFRTPFDLTADHPAATWQQPVLTCF